MKDLFIILGTIIAAIVVGTVLYYFGPASFRSAGQSATHEVSFRVLREGATAVSMDERSNYRIQDPQQLSELWGYLGLTPGSAPAVDFSRNEALAVFDGTHTTGGYSIQIERITEQDGTRTAHVLRVVPGPNCTSISAVTSPYQVVVVPKTDEPLTHEDETVTQDC